MFLLILSLTFVVARSVVKTECERINDEECELILDECLIEESDPVDDIFIIDDAYCDFKLNKESEDKNCDVHRPATGVQSFFIKAFNLLPLRRNFKPTS